jgi:hypothetical protein
VNPKARVEREKPKVRPVSPGTEHLTVMDTWKAEILEAYPGKKLVRPVRKHFRMMRQFVAKCGSVDVAIQAAGWAARNWEAFREKCKVDANGFDVPTEPGIKKLLGYAQQAIDGQAGGSKPKTVFMTIPQKRRMGLL